MSHETTVRSLRKEIAVKDKLIRFLQKRILELESSDPEIQELTAAIGFRMPGPDEYEDDIEE